MPEAAVALRLRRDRADRQSRRAPGAAASAGAGQDARHRPRLGAVAEAGRVQGRPVLAEPRQGARAAGRAAQLGGRLSRLDQAGRFSTGARSSPSSTRREARLPTRTRRSPRSRASSSSTEPGARRRRCGGGTRGCSRRSASRSSRSSPPSTGSFAESRAAKAYRRSNWRRWSFPVSRRGRRSRRRCSRPSGGCSSATAPHGRRSLAQPIPSSTEVQS